MDKPKPFSAVDTLDKTKPFSAVGKMARDVAKQQREAKRARQLQIRDREPSCRKQKQREADQRAQREKVESAPTERNASKLKKHFRKSASDSISRTGWPRLKTKTRTCLNEWLPSRSAGAHAHHR